VPHITVYSAIGVGGGRVLGNGILLDVKDPVHPKGGCSERSELFLLHSRRFRMMQQVVFTDEWAAAWGRGAVRMTQQVGRDAIFQLKDDKLSFANYYKLPAAQGDTENCVAHNGSLIPSLGAYRSAGVVPGRRLDRGLHRPGAPIRDCYFDRGRLIRRCLLGGEWSAYWYNGYIYVRDCARAGRL